MITSKWFSCSMVNIDLYKSSKKIYFSYESSPKQLTSRYGGSKLQQKCFYYFLQAASTQTKATNLLNIIQFSGLFNTS